MDILPIFSAFYFLFFPFISTPHPSLLGTLDLTNLAYDPDTLDLEEEEEETTEENQRTPKTSVSSVTTPPSTIKRIPFFKKVIVPSLPSS